MEIKMRPLYQPKHELYLSFDRRVDNISYRFDRGLYEYWKRTHLPFDFFGYIHYLKERYPEIKPRVLEGGCGIGTALEDLKRGITFNPITFTDAAKVDLETKEWKQFIKENDFEGFTDTIHTTGITLSEEHARFAEKTQSPFQVDEMFVGPIEQFESDAPFDLIYDFFGPMYYFPAGALRVYGKYLKPNRVACLRADYNILSNNKQNEVHRLIEENGFQIIVEKLSVDWGIDHKSRGNADLVVRKV